MGIYLIGNLNSLLFSSTQARKRGVHQHPSTEKRSSPAPKHGNEEFTSTQTRKSGVHQHPSTKKEESTSIQAQNRGVRGALTTEGSKSGQGATWGQGRASRCSRYKGLCSRGLPRPAARRPPATARCRLHADIPASLTNNWPLKIPNKFSSAKGKDLN